MLYSSAPTPAPRTSRRLLSPGLLALLVTAVPAAAQIAPVEARFCGPQDGRTPVLIVGTFHMANPGLDHFNVQADDMLHPRRQEEIGRLVRSLARFEPTVVALEARPGSGLQDRYRSYLLGEAAAGRNERQQLGFRVAEAVGLERVRGVDVQMSLPDSALGAAAAEDPRDRERLGELQRYGEAAVAAIAGWLENGSVGAALYEMNTPAAMAWAHRPYIDMVLPVRSGDDPVGAEYLTRWYERNILIFQNILELASSGDQRVYVVYGQGHAKILRDLVADHPDLCVEDPLPYLDAAR